MMHKKVTTVVEVFRALRCDPMLGTIAVCR